MACRSKNPLSCHPASAKFSLRRDRPWSSSRPGGSSSSRFGFRRFTPLQCRLIYLQTPLQYLKGVGPKRAADLQRVGLSTVEDLLYRFPLRYEDRGHLQPISSLKAGQQVGDRRPDSKQPAAHHAASGLQDLRSAHRRRNRLDRRRLDESVVPPGHPAA